jgi:hypothetical protein
MNAGAGSQMGARANLPTFPFVVPDLHFYLLGGFPTWP